MIDVTNPEGRLSFAELADLLPLDPGGRKIRVATLVRYATKGQRGVKLEAVRVGRTWYTTREAANRFFTSRVRAGSEGTPAPAPAAQRPSKAALRACREAEALGL